VQKNADAGWKGKGAAKRGGNFLFWRSAMVSKEDSRWQKWPIFSQLPRSVHHSRTQSMLFVSVYIHDMSMSVFVKHRLIVWVKTRLSICWYICHRYSCSRAMQEGFHSCLTSYLFC
jgi:hypothetical protein